MQERTRQGEPLFPAAGQQPGPLPGTLATVTTLAGYVGVDSAHPVAFAIFVNDIPTGQKGPARAMADDMLDVIVAYLEAEATR